MARRQFSYPLSLAIVVATLIAVTGGWIAWWNYRAGVDNVRTLANGLFDQIAREASGETESFLVRAPPAAATLAGIAALDPSDVDHQLLAKRFLAVLRANPSFTWVSYSDREGEFTGAYRTDSGKLLINHSRIADGKTVLDEYEVGKDDTWTPVRNEPDTKYDPRTRPFYTLAASAPHGVWTPPYVFEENVPGITYALAARSGGEVAGVFTIDFDLSRLSDLTRELQFSPNGRVAIVSDDNVVLAHPSAPVIRTVAGKPELVRVADLTDRTVQHIRAAGGARQLDIAGENYLVRTLAINVPGATGWHVVAYAPESDFTASMRGRVVSSLLISLIAVLIAVAVAWLLARRVSGPLTDVAAEMVKVGELRLDDSPVSHSMFREIEMMNVALTKMKGGLRSFARYVPRDLVRTLLASGHDAELKGELRELTIFFSDLEGFTTLAETKAPDELVRFLSEYFDDMSRLIAEERGTVDKYIGDGIMAFWGAPVRFDTHALHACKAALHCQRRVREFAARGLVLTTRIGLATGSVLVGNIGSTERMNYTVMGDIANLAARLEGLNKQYGTDLMISDVTFEQAREHIIARPVDVVTVKGKTRGVLVYELLALVSDNDAEAVAIADASERALKAYLSRQFTDAVVGWDEVLRRRPDDRPAQIMRTRALQHAAAPPPPEWTGVTAATQK